MTLAISLERHGVLLTDVQEQRVHRHLTALDRRLAHRPEPIAVVSFAGPDKRPEIHVSLRVQRGPLGPTLTRSQAASTPDRAAHLAIRSSDRQLERLVAGQRREPAYGVPSRRRLGTPPRHGEETQQEGPSSTSESRSGAVVVPGRYYCRA